MNSSWRIFAPSGVSTKSGDLHAADTGDRLRANALASRAWALGEKNPRFLGSVAIDLALVAALLDDGAQARRAFAYVNWEHLEGYTKLWAEAEGAAIEGLFDEAQAKARAGIAALERPRLARPSGRERERLQWLAGRGDVRA